DYLRFGDALDALSAAVDPEHPELAANAAELDRQTLDGFIRKLRLVPEADFLVRLQNRASYNAEARDLSMLFVAQQTAVFAGVPESASETMRVTGGNSLLPEAMAAALGDRVRLGSPITRVEYDADGVRVFSGGTPIDAAHLVIAMPMPPLRRGVYSPPPPRALAAVVCRLRPRAGGKGVPQGNRRFWGAAGVTRVPVTAPPPPPPPSTSPGPRPIPTRPRPAS